MIVALAPVPHVKLACRQDIWETSSDPRTSPMARQGGCCRHLTPAHMRKAPRGDEAPWRRRSRGRKEAPWDIIGGMTDDRIAYQFAQRPSASCVSLWKNLPLDDGTGWTPLWSSPGRRVRWTCRRPPHISCGGSLGRFHGPPASCRRFFDPGLFD